MISTNLHPISHRLQVIADYIRIPLFNTIVWGESLNSRPQNLASRNWKHRSIVRCSMCFDILNRLGVAHECDGQTDGQTTLAIATARSN